MTRPIVELRDIFKIYGAGETEVRALNGVGFTVQPGEFIAVMGPSGSGKSTCMNIVGCLDVPTHGSYQFLGVEVGELSREELAILRRTACWLHDTLLRSAVVVVRGRCHLC